ncbi:MAG: hypothetical protein E6K55_10205 [Gemmatimonadetes bacterium]|nr:MAG: hypothetical protein DMD67_11420 [Gemmatimonadota bacterium]TLY51546.1 MAG: hypothetical protein E6K55_10205 [Gemmatimonadota bacterium]
MPRPFLTARWSDIVLLTFEAPEDLIRRYVPAGVEPDRRDGRTHVSLVAVYMHEVRILGWRVPGFGAHPQVNFRTYVRVEDEPGVWFIRQLVPSRLIAAVGRLRYDEPFWPTPIRRRVLDTVSEVRAEYAVGPAALGWHRRRTHRSTTSPTACSRAARDRTAHSAYSAWHIPRGRYGKFARSTTGSTLARSTERTGSS